MSDSQPAAATAAPLLPSTLFEKMDPEISDAIFTFIFTKEKPLYKATIDALTKQRNLRPVFVERKPKAERFAWMKTALSRRSGNSVAAHLLQIWLVGAQAALLNDFLDHLGIEHDETGTVPELPPAPEKEKLLAAIDHVLARHDPRVVTLYLHAFQSLDDEGGWETLGAILAEDPRFRLK